MANLITKTLRMISTDGLWSTFKYGLFWLSEKYWERRLGVDTKGFILPKDLGQDNPEFQGYGPSDYQGLRRALKALTTRADRDVFLDLGSGMGRVVIMAAMFPFRKVIGVEIAKELNDVAKENVARSRRHLRCQEIELVTSDAALYAIPPEVTVIFIFSPVKGDTLRRVFDNIHRSLLDHPRRLSIIYHKTAFLLRDVCDRDWLVQRQTIQRHRNQQDLVIYEAVVQSQKPDNYEAVVQSQKPDNLQRGGPS